MEANFANGYLELSSDLLPSLFDTPTFSINETSDDQLFTVMDTKLLKKSMKDAAEEEEKNAEIWDMKDVTPGVFLTGPTFPPWSTISVLNKEQAHDFKIICNHALGHYQESDRHLLMGVFGEGGTGKSRLINAL
jgi:hypothetical protein